MGGLVSSLADLVKSNISKRRVARVIMPHVEDSKSFDGYDDVHVEVLSRKYAAQRLQVIDTFDMGPFIGRFHLCVDVERRTDKMETAIGALILSCSTAGGKYQEEEDSPQIDQFKPMDKQMETLTNEVNQFIKYLHTATKLAPFQLIELIHKEKSVIRGHIRKILLDEICLFKKQYWCANAEIIDLSGRWIEQALIKILILNKDGNTESDSAPRGKTGNTSMLDIFEDSISVKEQREASLPIWLSKARDNHCRSSDLPTFRTLAYAGMSLPDKACLELFVSSANNISQTDALETSPDQQVGCLSSRCCLGGDKTNKNKHTKNVKMNSNKSEPHHHSSVILQPSTKPMKQNVSYICRKNIFGVNPFRKDGSAKLINANSHTSTEIVRAVFNTTDIIQRNVDMLTISPSPEFSPVKDIQDRLAQMSLKSPKVVEQDASAVHVEQAFEPLKQHFGSESSHPDVTIQNTSNEHFNKIKISKSNFEVCSHPKADINKTRRNRGKLLKTKIHEKGGSVSDLSEHGTKTRLSQNSSDSKIGSLHTGETLRTSEDIFLFHNNLYVKETPSHEYLLESQGDTHLKTNKCDEESGEGDDACLADISINDMGTIELDFDINEKDAELTGCNVGDRQCKNKPTKGHKKKKKKKANKYQVSNNRDKNTSDPSDISPVIHTPGVVAHEVNKEFLNNNDMVKGFKGVCGFMSNKIRDLLCFNIQMKVNKKLTLAHAKDNDYTSLISDAEKCIADIEDVLDKCSRHLKSMEFIDSFTNDNLISQLQSGKRKLKKELVTMAKEAQDVDEKLKHAIQENYQEGVGELSKDCDGLEMQESGQSEETASTYMNNIEGHYDDFFIKGVKGKKGSKVDSPQVKEKRRNRPALR